VVGGGARDAERLAAAAGGLGDKALAVAADVGAPGDVERLFAEAQARFGKVDGLINNAAIYDIYEITDVSAERIRATVDANLLGPMLCARAAIPLMAAAGGGDIVNISSEAVRSRYPYLTGYSATKAALETFSQGLRQEIRGQRIRVSAVRLGGMDDPDPKTNWEPAMAARWMQEAAGALAYGGQTLMPFETVANAVIDILSMSPETTCDFMELRPTV
jgi:NAD(P)-dependent dehydrogenase (short-subunit alcohol dehydrogenase family)